MMPSSAEEFEALPGKLKKQPGAGPFGHKAGLIIELGCEYIFTILVFEANIV